MKIRELIVKLGFKADLKEADQFIKKVDDTKKKLSQNTSSNTGTIFSKFKNSFGGFAKNPNAEDAEFSDKVDSTLKSILDRQEYLNKLSEQERRKKVQFYKFEKQAIREVEQEERQSLKRRERAQRAFASLFGNRLDGLDAGATLGKGLRRGAAAATGAILLSLRGSLKDLETFKQISAGKKKSDGTIFFSKKDVEVLTGLNKQFLIAKGNIKDVRNSIVVALAPAFETLVKTFNSWIKQNKQFIQLKTQNFVTGVAEALRTLANVGLKALGVLDNVVEVFGGWGTVLKALLALGITSWLFNLGIRIVAIIRNIVTLIKAFFELRLGILALRAVFQSLPIALLITGFGLLANEIYTTVKGGDSLINRFLKTDAWKWCADSINKLIDSFKSLWQWITKVETIKLFGADKTKIEEMLARRGFAVNDTNIKKTINMVKQIDGNFEDAIQNLENRIVHNRLLRQQGKEAPYMNNNVTLNVKIEAGSELELEKAVREQIMSTVTNELDKYHQKMVDSVGAY